MNKLSYNFFKIMCCFFIFVSSFTLVYSEENTIELSLVKDGILLGSGALFALSSELLIYTQDIPVPDDLQKSDINPFDGLAVYPFSENLDLGGKLCMIGSLATPAILALNTHYTDWLDIGIIYSEAMLFSFGLKNFLKYFVKRYRPYMYHDEIQPEQLADSDFTNSLPSGHTTLAFTSAAFTSYMFAYYNPESYWIIPVTSVSFGLAAATAYLRVSSGNHFITDVIAGALIGTASGFLFPVIHIEKDKKPGSSVMQNQKSGSITTIIGFCSISVKIPI